MTDLWNCQLSLKTEKIFWDYCRDGSSNIRSLSWERENFYGKKVTRHLPTMMKLYKRCVLCLSRFSLSGFSITLDAQWWRIEGTRKISSYLHDSICGGSGGTVVVHTYLTTVIGLRFLLRAVVWLKLPLSHVTRVLSTLTLPSIAGFLRVLRFPPVVTLDPWGLALTGPLGRTAQIADMVIQYNWRYNWIARLVVGNIVSKAQFLLLIRSLMILSKREACQW